ncbi:MAG: M20/M25/M40 family metallo-hydrolase [Acidobacteriota bacterium]
MSETLRPSIEKTWRESIVPALHEFIRIPNQSPAYDPGWQSHGFMDRAVELAVRWVKAQGVAGLGVEVLSIPGRTPVVLLELAGQTPGTVLLYGHLDKQPPFEGWRDGLGPWTPVEEDGKLYGRGAADDGYATFAIVAAMKALQAAEVPHPRLVGLIECSEESGSPDLPAYMDALGDRLGSPALVVGLDSGCGDYERLWNTTSLRGLIAGNLWVGVLTEGVHSGDASGIVPSSFRILRILLDRIDDAASGTLRPRELSVEVPKERAAQASAAAGVIGDAIHGKFPFRPGTRAIDTDLTELLLNRTWRPALSVTAVAGMPPLEQGGNVLRPFTAVKLSLRIPPTLDAVKATAFVKELLERDPPYGATVRFDAEKSSAGWNAPPLAPWLDAAIAKASRDAFGRPPCAMGEGGSIPFMHMLGQKFPQAQFLITGVLGPHSNAHGPNEFLHIETAIRVTMATASIVADAGRELSRSS